MINLIASFAAGFAFCALVVFGDIELSADTGGTAERVPPVSALSSAALVHELGKGRRGWIEIANDRQMLCVRRIDPDTREYNLDDIEGCIQLPDGADGTIEYPPDGLSV